MYQVVRGLSDLTAQERILDAAAQVEGEELSLTLVIKLAEAFEMGKSTQELVNANSQLSCLSDHQAKKQGARQTNKLGQQRLNQSKSNKKVSCGNCGRSDHTSSLWRDWRNVQILTKCVRNVTITAISCSTATVVQGSHAPRVERTSLRLMSMLSPPPLKLQLLKMIRQIMAPSQVVGCCCAVRSTTTLKSRPYTTSLL